MEKQCNHGNKEIIFTKYNEAVHHAEVINRTKTQCAGKRTFGFLSTFFKLNGNLNILKVQ